MVKKMMMNEWKLEWSGSGLSVRVQSSDSIPFLFLYFYKTYQWYSFQTQKCIELIYYFDLEMIWNFQE